MNYRIAASFDTRVYARDVPCCPTINRSPKFVRYHVLIALVCAFPNPTAAAKGSFHRSSELLRLPNPTRTDMSFGTNKADNSRQHSFFFSRGRCIVIAQHHYIAPYPLLHITTALSTTMPPRKRRQATSPRTTRSKRANISKSPQSQWSDILSPAPPSHPPTPEGLQPHDCVRSASPPDFPTTAKTYQTRSVEPQETGTSHMDDVDALSMSSPFMDWLETHVGSYDAKQRASEQFDTAEFERDNTSAAVDNGTQSKVKDQSSSQGKPELAQHQTRDDPGGVQSQADISEQSGEDFTMTDTLPTEAKQTGQTGDQSNISKEDASSSHDQASPKSNNANTDGAPTRPTYDKPEAAPHTHQPPRKDKSKSKKGKAPAKDSHKSAGTKPALSADDAGLVRALERISGNHALIRGLLFHIAQQVPEARKLILEACVQILKFVTVIMYTNSFAAMRGYKRCAKTPCSTQTISNKG